MSDLLTPDVADELLTPLHDVLVISKDPRVAEALAALCALAAHERAMRAQLDAALAACDRKDALLDRCNETFDGAYATRFNAYHRVGAPCEGLPACACCAIREEVGKR